MSESGQQQREREDGGGGGRRGGSGVVACACGPSRSVLTQQRQALTTLTPTHSSYPIFHYRLFKDDATAL